MRSHKSDLAEEPRHGNSSISVETTQFLQAFAAETCIKLVANWLPHLMQLQGKRDAVTGEKRCSYWEKEMQLLGKRDAATGKKRCSYWEKEMQLLGKLTPPSSKSILTFVKHDGALEVTLKSRSLHNLSCLIRCRNLFLFRKDCGEKKQGKCFFLHA